MLVEKDKPSVAKIAFDSVIDVGCVILVGFFAFKAGRHLTAKFKNWVEK